MPREFLHAAKKVNDVIVKVNVSRRCLKPQASAQQPIEWLCVLKCGTYPTFDPLNTNTVKSLLK